MDLILSQLVEVSTSEWNEQIEMNPLSHLTEGLGSYN